MVTKIEFGDKPGQWTEYQCDVCGLIHMEEDDAECCDHALSYEDCEYHPDKCNDCNFTGYCDCPIRAVR